jgi:hypothetical protein
MVAARLQQEVGRMLGPGGVSAELADDLAERRTDPYRAAAVLLERLRGGSGPKIDPGG